MFLVKICPLFFHFPLTTCCPQATEGVILTTEEDPAEQSEEPGDGAMYVGARHRQSPRAFRRCLFSAKRGDFNLNRLILNIFILPRLRRMAACCFIPMCTRVFLCFLIEKSSFGKQEDGKRTKHGAVGNGIWSPQLERVINSSPVDFGRHVKGIYTFDQGRCIATCAI